MNTLTQRRPLNELYIEAADQLDAAIPSLMAIVVAHPIPCSFLVAHVQGCVCSMRSRADWLRQLASHNSVGAS